MDETRQNNKDRNFKGQYQHEEVIGFFRNHWISIVLDLIMYGVFVALFILALVNFSSITVAATAKPFFQIVLILGVMIMTYLFHHIFVNIINHFLDTVIITNFRVVEIKKTIFLKDSHDSFYMETIQDVGKEQNGIWKNIILHFGELVIHLASNDIKVIKFVPNPDYHFRLINKIRREHLREHVEGKALEWEYPQTVQGQRPERLDTESKPNFPMPKPSTESSANTPVPSQDLGPKSTFPN